MIVQSQLSGQLYEVPDGLMGYEEYYDPRLGLPFLAPLIPKIASIASKVLPGLLPGGRGGGGRGPAIVPPQVCPPCPPQVCPPCPIPLPAPPVPQPMRLAGRRRRPRSLAGVPGYGYYGWYGY